LLVVTGARCPLTKPVVTAVELQATTEPHCSRCVQPGGICVYVVQREPRSGVGLAPRPQALPMPAAALVLYICVALPSGVDLGVRRRSEGMGTVLHAPRRRTPL
jgi:hypothetical protein